MNVEAPVKARRGDLIVVQRHPSYLDDDEDFVEVGVVTNVTRDGHVKRWRDAKDGGRDLLEVGFLSSHIAPKETIDVAAALTTAAAREWPGGGAAMPYSSLGEAREALRPYLTGAEISRLMRVATEGARTDG